MVRIMKKQSDDSYKMLKTPEFNRQADAIQYLENSIGKEAKATGHLIVSSPKVVEAEVRVNLRMRDAR